MGGKLNGHELTGLLYDIFQKQFLINLQSSSFACIGLLLLLLFPCPQHVLACMY